MTSRDYFQFPGAGTELAGCASQRIQFGGARDVTSFSSNLSLKGDIAETDFWAAHLQLTRASAVDKTSTDTLCPD